MTDKLFSIADEKLVAALKQNFDAESVKLYRKLRSDGQQPMDAHIAVVDDHTRRKAKPR